MASSSRRYLRNNPEIVIDTTYQHASLHNMNVKKPLPQVDENIKLLQFKVTLAEVKPTIWRRFQISSNNTFWDLHTAIQNVMNWNDCHLHRFHIKNPTTGKYVYIGKPLGYRGSWFVDEEMAQGFISLDPSHPIHAENVFGTRLYTGKVFKSWKIDITKYINETSLQSGYEIEYLYDFGDNWEMKLEFEGFFPLTSTLEQCICLGGENAAPPEDTGDYYKYEILKTALRTPNVDRTKDQKKLFDWVHNFMKMPDFDPFKFDHTSVVFKDGSLSPKFHELYSVSPTLEQKMVMKLGKEEEKKKKNKNARRGGGGK